MDHHIVKDLIKHHIAKTIGCTDIGVVGYIASIGAHILKNKTIKDIHLMMSDELYKNSVNVGVPGIRKSGLAEALALGLLIRNPKHQLSIFEAVTKEVIENITSLLETVHVKIEHKKFPETVLYEALTLTSTDGDVVEIVIKDHYLRVYKVVMNGKKLPAFETNALIEDIAAYQIKTFDEILSFVRTGDVSNFDMLIDIARVQYDNARTELMKDQLPVLAEHLDKNASTFEHALSMFLKAHIEVSSKKRMIGDIFTVYGVAGSGNLGIGTFITPMFLWDALNLDEATGKKLVLLSFLTSVYVKQSMHIVTVLCGTGHAIGCSAAACHTLAMGGTDDEIKNAMNLYLSSSMGYVCDGAKVSCTYKVSFAAMNGLIASQMVLKGDAQNDGLGLNKLDIDQTIKNLGKLNNEILDSANKGIISLI